MEAQLKPIKDYLVRKEKKLRDIILGREFDHFSKSGFTMVPNLLLVQADLSSNAKVVYSLLLSYAWQNDCVFPGQKTLEVKSGMNQSTISRAMKELQGVGWLKIVRRGQGKTNLYYLSIRVKPKHSIRVR